MTESLSGLGEGPRTDYGSALRALSEPTEQAQVVIDICISRPAETLRAVRSLFVLLLRSLEPRSEFVLTAAG